jgi:PAS domain S-box-containing protein
MPDRDGAFWHAIVDALTESVVVRDHNGIVVFVNSAAERFAGIGARDVVGGQLGARVDRVVSERGEPLTVADLPAARVLATGVQVGDQVFGIETMDHGLRWVMVSAAPVPFGDPESSVGVVTTALDVTDRVMAEQSLRASEERFRSAVDSMPDGFVLYRAQRNEHGEIVDLICEFANDALVVNGGVPAAAQLGRGILELFPEIHEQGVFERYVQVVETGASDFFEVPWFQSDLVTGSFEMRVAKCGDGCVLVVRDVTERRRSETELARSNDELAEFAAIAAHDLAEPLRGLTGFVGLLGREYGERLDPEAQRWIEHIGQGADRMRMLIDDLLTYAKAGSGSPPHDAVDLNEVAVAARDSLAAMFRDTAATVAFGELPVVEGNRTQLLQLLQNLLGNALKFATPGTPPSIAVDAERDGAFWRVQVTDNGVGVPPAEQERVFAPFHRAHLDDEHPGSGLGLAICRRVAERHGGRIWVEPAPEGGSRFCVMLPASRLPS